jgi:hypothetical protein
MHGHGWRDLGGARAKRCLFGQSRREPPLRKVPLIEGAEVLRYEIASVGPA